MGLRPLDRIPSIKVKLSVVIVAAVAISAIVSTVGLRAGIPLWLRPIIAAGIALLLVYPFSRGITAPLRQMVRATRSMAEGDFTEPVLVTSLDEVGELARAFEDMREQLHAVDRERRDFVANASHELRTPISAMRATLENLVDGVGDPDPAHLQMLLEQAERLGALVEQLLDLSRLESGTATLHRESCDITELMGEVAAETRAGWPHAEVVVDSDGSIRWSADRLRLHQVLTNLVQNAVRHAPPSTAVEVAVAERGGALRLSVADRGPGIAPEERSSVFERFYRLDHARSSNSGGTGLGLAIARGIVDLHGGRLWVEDNQPSGCRLVVELPKGEDDG